MVQLDRHFSAPTFRSGTTSAVGNGGSGGTDTIQFRSDGTCDGAEVSLVSDMGYNAHLVLMQATGQMVRDDAVGDLPG